MVAKKKYKDPVRVEHVCDMLLFNKLTKALNKLPNNVTRTDLINSMITHCLKESDISKIVIEYKNK